jgi:hypothetical protein
MIRKIFRILIELLKFGVTATLAFILLAIFFIVGAISIITGKLQKKESVDPIIHSRHGKVVDLNGFRADKTRGEL